MNTHTTDAPTQTWTLRELAEPLAIMKLDPDGGVPAWVWNESDFVSVTRTDDELSVICSAEAAHDHDDVAGPYVAFFVDQHLDFLLTGVLSGLLEPVSEAGISILAMSTYDTDWILVPADEVDDAVAAWRRRGHTVARDPRP
jgi:uncharacterized protein